MHFGFESMATLSFVPIGFVIVTVASLALGCVYAVGAARGGDAARAYTRACAVLFVMAIAGDLVFAVSGGQWTRFMQWFGLGPLVELALLAFMWVATMWLMAFSYSTGKAREDRARAATEGEG